MLSTFNDGIVTCIIDSLYLDIIFPRMRLIVKLWSDRVNSNCKRRESSQFYCSPFCFRGLCSIFEEKITPALIASSRNLRNSIEPLNWFYNKKFRSEARRSEFGTSRSEARRGKLPKKQDEAKRVEAKVCRSESKRGIENLPRFGL